MVCRIQMIACLVVVGGLLSGSGALASDWKAVQANKLLNVSGMALASAPGAPVLSMLIAHDNKGKKVYTSKLTWTPTGELKYEALDWDTWVTEPFDLEGLCRVPGTDTFIAMPSKAGVAYHIKIVPAAWGGEEIKLIKEFSMPELGMSEVEGVTVGSIGGQTILVWTARGKAATPGRIAYASLDLTTYTVGVPKVVEFSVPWPNTPYLRHISDVALLDSGALLVTSCSDPGDYGPFASALYLGGQFFADADGNVQFQVNSEPITLRRFKGHKVEAVTILEAASAMAFGTDDEEFGGSVLLDQ